jgi:hypothetical protein
LRRTFLTTLRERNGDLWITLALGHRQLGTAEVCASHPSELVAALAP